VPAPSRPALLIGETRSVSRESPPSDNAKPVASIGEEELLRRQVAASPHWQGKQLRVSVGTVSENIQQMSVGFSVLNGPSRTIELLPPQIELTGTSRERHQKSIKAEQLAIKDYT
jgi:hypothetical protein